MTSSRPYLIRAIYEWIVDNQLTPHLLVDAAEDVTVPRDYVENGRIVLNVAPMAVSALQMGNEEISFSARFGGRPMNICIPIPRVQAIYARENGQGMMFPAQEEGDPPPGEEEGDTPAPRKGPSLRVVK